MFRFLLVLTAATALKLLFMFGYHSTDFEVHRNWKALTYSLPVSQWYIESTSKWTLDYPPLFAWFEFALAHIGQYVDPKLIIISKEPYVSVPTIVYLRSTVILSELLLFFSLWRLCKVLSDNSCPLMKRRFISMGVLLVFNFGLIIVDHIHFQYNGLLFGILLLSVSFLIEKRFIAASITFTVLLNMKHIFMYVAPVYFLHILIIYCLEKRALLEFVRRFLKVGLSVLIVTILSFGPFIYTNQLQQIWTRLFPFGRGLCHAYWAPNMWALYNTLDKVLVVLNSQYHFAASANSQVASMTGGLVGEIHHAILPTIRPVHTAVLAAFGMLPALIQYMRVNAGAGKNVASQNYVQFLIGLTATAWSSFLFGWHVHEKAVLMILLPLNLLAISVPKYRFIAFYTTTLGHYSLIPLIHSSAETPAVISMFLAYTALHWLVLFRFHSNPADERKQQTKRAESLPLATRLIHLHLWGLLVLFICTRLIFPLSSYRSRFPFAPLMATSVYTAFGLSFAFLWFVTSSFSDYDSVITSKVSKTARKDTNKLKVQ